jgi:hypothetical protein
MNKFFIFSFLIILSGLAQAENIKLFIHAAGGETHKYAIELKNVVQKTQDNLIIEVAAGIEMSGVARSFKNEKGPAMAIISGTTLAKGINEKKYNISDYSSGNILFFNEIGLTCKKPCQFKSFEDVIGNTEKVLKVGVSSSLSKQLGENIKKSGAKIVLISYSGGWPEMLPELMSGTLDLVSIINSDRKNDNIVQLTIPKKYGIQTETWMVLLYKNIPEEKFLKWYTDNSFVERMKMPKNVTETNYLKLLNETVKNTQ